MALEDLKERLKETTPWKRYIAVFLLALIPAGYYLYESWEPLLSEKTTAEGSLNEAKVKLSDTKLKAERLPELENRLDIIQGNLKEARRILPNKISVNEILHLVGSIAKQNEVDLEQFKFEPEVKASSGNYYETPIRVVVQGNYRDVAAFYDHIVHSNKMIHIRELGMDSSKLQKAGANESEYVIKSDSILVVYRGA